MPDEVVSLRDEIENAIDQVEPADSPLRAPEEQGAKPPAQGSPEGVTPQPKPDDQQSGAAPAPAAKPADQAGLKEGQPAAAPQELKAPAQWKPAVREKWNQLPREVQEEVLRREGDALRLIGSVGPKIRLAEEVGQQLAPFMEQITSNGVTPQAFLGDVMTTVRSLAHGTMEQKATTIANIVQSYGVDLRVLDQVLTQRMQAPRPTPGELAARQEAARAQAALQQHQTSIERFHLQTAAKTLEQFGSDPKHEFFSDVRELMADLLETGRATNMDDAYTSAIWAHPETRKILLQREAEQRAASRGQRAARARQASSSAHGAPLSHGMAPQQGKMSLRDTIAQAFDEHTSL